MKQKILIFGLITSLLLLGCALFPLPSSPEIPDSSQTAATSDIMLIEPDPLLEEYLTHLDILDAPSREYGESTGYIRLQEDLMIRILYPEGEVSALNDSILNWVEDTVAEYGQEAQSGSQHSESAELTVDYDSYLLNENLISVKMTGLFDKPYLAHPVDIIATFHASLRTGELVTLDELLLADGKEALQNLIIRDACLDATVADEHLLDLWTLNAKGLEITLERGSYLPMSAGTVVLQYPPEQLDGILSPDLLPAGETSSEQPDNETHTQVTPEPDVSLPPVIDPEKPMVALTFDDGPSKHTDRLLDIFAANGGKGTFFVLGNLLDNRPDTLKRITAEGHQIAGHGWDHRQLTKLSDDELIAQLMNTRAKILEITGTDTTIVRPPYGSVNDNVKKICAALGFVMINWSVDTLDWDHQDVNKICDAILNDVESGDIILCHDLYGTTVDAMEIVIPALLEKGYQLVTVSELLEYGDQTVTAGNVYKKQ